MMSQVAYSEVTRESDGRRDPGIRQLGQYACPLFCQCPKQKTNLKGAKGVEMVGAQGGGVKDVAEAVALPVDLQRQFNETEAHIMLDGQRAQAWV